MRKVDQIRGVHHVTPLAAEAQNNSAFFTKTLGLRRVKKTVNFDATGVYHLYYGDDVGAPGSVMTHFPFPNIARGRPGTGEVGETVFSVPEGSLPFWTMRFAALSVDGLKSDRLSARSVSNSPVPMAMASHWSRPRETCACHGPAAASARITRSGGSTPSRSDSWTKAPPPNCSSSWATRKSIRPTA
jgi:catechol 2,3-dioxygenase-like lactoylglutathione lyase family enzyme